MLSDHSIKSITLVTSRCRLLESRLRSVYNYAIPPLSQSDWQDYFTYSNVNFDQQSLAEMHSKLGGNAKAMTSLCGEIYMDFDRDATNFWQQRGTDILASADLKDLVAGHVERLVNVEPLAYALLRRMGCYRYQSIPHIPIEALLCQLWDSPEAGHIEIIEVLKNRSLLELANGEYSLHPLVRAEAVRHLKQNEEEFTKAHNSAADFWKAKVQSLDTDRDLLMSIEPCYHYLEINTLDKILAIFLNSEIAENQHLHTAFYGRVSPTLMFDLLQKVEAKALCLPIEQGMPIIGVVKFIYGNLYMCSGRSHEAIIEYEESAKNTEKPDSPQLMFYYITSIFHIIMCKFELGEFEALITMTKKYMKNVEHYKILCKHPFIAPFLSTYLHVPLSLVYVLEDNQDGAGSLVEETYAAIVNNSGIMGGWGKGLSLIYLGFICAMSKRLDQALGIYNTALKLSCEMSDPLIQGKTLCGLAETYRKMGDLTKAKEYCLQSKNILMKIESKLDLAKVLVEEALIAREMREHGYQDNFEKAIALFTELNAPKHVERVRRLMS